MSLLNLIVAVAIMAVGVGTATLIVVSQGEQRTALAAQSQRASYATFQAEVAGHGIDPAGIINPLASVSAQRDTTNASSSSNLTNLRSTSTTEESKRGGTEVGRISVAVPTQTGERSGTAGSQIVADGTDSAGLVVSGPLDAPTVRLPSRALTIADFPATNWFSFPSTNPPGTVYRYTVDGTEPAATSPIWSVAAAQSITPATLPAAIRIQAYHTDPSHLPSTVASTNSLTYVLSPVTFGRAQTPATAANVVTYAEQFTQPNPITLALAAADSGVPATIYYTTDGSDPSSSGTRIAYTGPFIVPTSHWSWNGVEGSPATAQVRAVVMGNSPYVASTSQVFGLTNQPLKLAPPTFNLANSTSYAIGQTATLSHPQSSTIYPPVIRVERLNEPSNTSTSATSFTLR